MPQPESTFMKLRTLFAALLLAVPAMLAAAPVDIGPAVGSRIPALAAQTTSGTAASLRSIEGKKGTVLVFFRSAKWCPYCQRQLIDLKALQGPIETRGYRLAAISYDPPEVLARFASEHGIGYALLSDSKSAMIDAFKLRDPQYPVDSFAYGVPKPAIFVVGPDGRVKAKLAEEGYKVRPGNDAVVAAIDGLR